MGDAVNVAARMEQTAEPGTVQITAETYRRIASSFDAEPRGGVEVKGKTEPVVAYRVVGRKQQPETPSRTHATPLVGREHEMEILTRAIADVHEGRGRIVSLIAEAGLGKSRLIEETQQEWGRLRPDDDPRSIWDVRRIWEMWQCVSYDTTRPYAQYRRMLARIAGSATPTRRTSFGRSWYGPSTSPRSGWNLTCASGAHCSVCRNPTTSRSRGRRSRTRSWNWSRHRPATRAPHLGCWCSRTSIGATRRRWTC